MRSDVRSRPFNFAAQVLAGGEATLVRTPQRRFRIKGEDDEEPAALVEPEDKPRPAVADAPLDPVVLRNRAKIAALRRERVRNAPLDLGDLLRTRDGLFPSPSSAWASASSSSCARRRWPEWCPASRVCS